MKRRVYEAPITERFLVEMEGSFCSGSADVKNPEGSNGGISDHEVNTGFTADFDAGDWDSQQ